ncbi:hypothetical protein, partial [Micromonospora sp. NPDC003776]
NHQLSLAEILAFTNGSDDVLRDLHQGLHSADAPPSCWPGVAPPSAGPSRPPPLVVCMSSSLSAMGAPSGVPPRRTPGFVVQRVVPHVRSSLTTP